MRDQLIITHALQQHQEVLSRTIPLFTTVLPALIDDIVSRLQDKNKILICGNGGSAADAQHFAAELIGRYEINRQALSAIALSTDTSNLTAIGNDFGYEYVFSRQVEGLAQPGDILIALSTSGNSKNILHAVKQAQRLGLKIIGLTGDDGGELARLVADTIRIPSKRTSRIQEMHELCLHVIAESIEKRFAP